MENPIEIQLLINQIPVKLQLDTGSPITLVTEHVWKNMKDLKLQQEKLKLSSFSGHRIQLQDSSMVDVQFQRKFIKLKLFVVTGARTNILGRDWIEKLQ